jgi:tetrahydromethanopterin S-methyltransferase subunit G
MVTIEERVSRLEGVYEQVDSRLDDLNQSMNGLRAEMTSKFAEVNSRINTLYVILAGSWVTMMVAIIGLYFKG